MFQCLSEHGIIINPSKCRFGVSELEFLGHTVSSQGIRPSDTKVKAITDFPMPTSLRKIREFLGLVDFHHGFIPQCASILGPLNSLLATPHGKDRTLEWTEAATTAFNKIKEALATATLVTHPKPFVPTCIMTDASDTAVGAVLQQQIDGDWQPIAYFSKKLRPAETRYSTFDRELLAIYLTIKHFRHFVEGREFYIATDHKPLTFALSTASDKYAPRPIHHLDYIAQFSTDNRHVAGHHNLVADAQCSVFPHCNTTANCYSPGVGKGSGNRPRTQGPANLHINLSPAAISASPCFLNHYCLRYEYWHTPPVRTMEN